MQIYLLQCDICAKKYFTNEYKWIYGWFLARQIFDLSKGFTELLNAIGGKCLIVAIGKAE
jgi:hypothetical protein